MLEMGNTLKIILKLLTLPYKHREEEWLTRGTITSKIEQRIKKSGLLVSSHGK